jgi:type VI protein secretion system component VasF
MNTLRIPHPLRESAVDQSGHHAERARQADALRARRRHRWTIIACIAAAGVVAYVLGLGWFANRLADDLSTQINPIPAFEDQQHRAD